MRIEGYLPCEENLQTTCNTISKETQSSEAISNDQSAQSNTDINA